MAAHFGLHEHLRVERLIFPPHENEIAHQAYAKPICRGMDVMPNTLQQLTKLQNAFKMYTTRIVVVS